MVGMNFTYIWRGRIRCPECGREFDAPVTYEEGDPWPAYVAECECGYVVTESEWEEV